MYNGSLFERLSEEYNFSSCKNEQEAIYASVANNITRILSTNTGSAQTVDDYGLPDLNDATLSMKDLIEKIEFVATNSISKYEPRLFQVKVSILKESLTYNEMNIFIEGIIIVNKQNQRINLKANLLKNGKVKIYQNGI